MLPKPIYRNDWSMIRSFARLQLNLRSNMRDAKWKCRPKGKPPGNCRSPGGLSDRIKLGTSAIPYASQRLLVSGSRVVPLLLLSREPEAFRRRTRLQEVIL